MTLNIKAIQITALLSVVGIAHAERNEECTTAVSSAVAFMTSEINK